MRKGSISSMIEIYFGVIIIMFLFFSSIYFAQRSEVNAEADVVAVNTGFECYNNLNNILKSENIFDSKTSYYLGKSDKDLENLESIRSYLVNMNSNYKLSISEDCESYIDGCEIEGENTVIIGDILGKKVDAKCSLAITKSNCEEDCVKFLNMEVYK